MKIVRNFLKYSGWYKWRTSVASIRAISQTGVYMGECGLEPFIDLDSWEKAYSKKITKEYLLSHPDWRMDTDRNYLHDDFSLGVYFQDDGDLLVHLYGGALPGVRTIGELGDLICFLEG